MVNVELTIIETAARLFYERGFNATGVDLIIAESKCAKSTLYQKFKTKDELVCSVLRSRHASWMDWLEKVGQNLVGTPEERTRMLFDLLAQWFAAPNYHGSLFLNAAAEFGSPTHPCKEVIRRHIEETDARVAELLGIEGFEASKIGLIIRGAMTTATVDRTDNVAITSKAVAMMTARYAQTPPNPSGASASTDPVSTIGY